MKILGHTIKSKTLRTLTLIIPLSVILFSYQQCSRTCPVEVNREVGSVGTSGALPFCSIDSTVACVNDFRSCGEHADSTKWFEDGTNVLPKDRTCTYGDVVTDKYIEQVQYICKDGTVAPTGVTKEGPIQTAGQCSNVPFNCGAHLDSTKWWEPDTTLQKFPRTCDQPTADVYNYYKSENEYKCDNGKIIPTEQKRLISVEKIDNCSNELNCGSHTEGSTWYENMGTVQSPRICSDPAHTPVQDIFSRKKELKCDRGVIVEQAVTLVGDLLTYGECPGTLNCGDYRDGQTWKETTNDELTDNFVCSDRLTQATTRYKKIDVKQCINGVVSVKETIKGDLLSIGSCPRAGCIPFLDGERWLADLGLEVSLPKDCQFGPTNPAPVTTYVNLQEAQCSKGDTVPTGYLQQGDKKRETTCYSCAPSSKQTCTQPHGVGSQVCKSDGTGFNSCVLDICDAGFYKDNGVCTPQVCTPAQRSSCEYNSTAKGTKTCNDNGSAYGTCNFDSCNAGYVNVPAPAGTRGPNCAKIICTPDSVDHTGCAPLVTAVPGGTFDRQCNSLGNAYLGCVLSCTDGSAPRNGKCTLYNWVAASTWSSCNQDCGGTQTQDYICKNNFGETVADSKCTSAKPVVSRACNSKTSPWTDGMEIVSPSSREACPGLYLGYVEKTYQKPISYSCVDYKKVKTLGNQVLLSTHNYCSAIQPARCSQDSLAPAEALNRLNWMKACQEKVSVIKTFFDIIGGADQLSKYLNDTSSAQYGKDRPRPLYITFSDQANKPWIAPKTYTTAAAANCTVPADLKIFGICTSSCYTPDQKLLFNVAGKQEYIPIIDAINQKQDSIMTLTQDSVMEQLKYEPTSIAHFVSELVDTNHKIRTFNTVSGGKLSVTYNHPLVASDGVIREASDFKVGDQLIKADGSFDEVSSIDEIIYPGKVHNVLPYGESTLGNIIVSEGFLSGSAYYQNDGVNYMNQQILRSNLLQGVDLQKQE